MSTTTSNTHDHPHDEAPDNAQAKDENRIGEYGYVPRTESPYTVLGLDRHCSTDYTDADVNKAYRKASLKAHPDRPGGSVAKFNRITASYNLIKTEELRQRHEEFGQRLEPGAGEMLGETIDKLKPFALGIGGGLVSSLGYWSETIPTSELQLTLWICVVGSGPLTTAKVAQGDALLTSFSGMFVGGGVGSLLCGLGYGALKLIS